MCFPLSLFSSTMLPLHCRFAALVLPLYQFTCISSGDLFHILWKSQLTCPTENRNKEEFSVEFVEEYESGSLPVTCWICEITGFITVAVWVFCRISVDQMGKVELSDTQVSAVRSKSSLEF